MKDFLMFSTVIVLYFFIVYLFYKFQLVFLNKKFEKIDKNKYRLLKSTNNKKFKMEYFKNEEWKEFDTFDANYAFFLFRPIQEETYAKSLFNSFVKTYENKEECINKKEEEELEYKIVK